MDAHREVIRENIDYDLLLQDHPLDAEQIDGYVELMVEVCCSTRDFIRISKEDVPTGVVKARFLKLTREHIKYVMDCLRRNTTQIGNIKVEFQKRFAKPGEFMLIGTDTVCASPGELAMNACKLWESMRNGESVVLTKWDGSAEGGASA